MWVQDILNDDDVEEKRFTNPDVKNWLDMLRFAVFEVDCLFDAINSEASRRKVEAAYDILISSSFVLKSIFSPFKRLNTEMDSKRQKFIERLGWLNPAVQQGGLGVFNSSSVSHETPTSSILVDESSIYGRDFDIKKLKNILLSTDCGDSKMRMISIVGMGGIGKTTLAKLLYNDREVKEKFELKLWVYISKDFDILRVLETMLESVVTI
jgi:ABC-type transport system involved in cytochrome bd biosynthesis fused ATPase/permease subunit